MKSTATSSRLASACRRCHGSIYVFVLGIAVMVSVVGMSLLTVTQLNARSTGGANDAVEAAILAESAVEHAQTVLGSNPGWRTTYTSGQATTPLTLGRGTISFKLVDEVDGMLGNNASDPVRIYGIGKVGRAVRVYSTESLPGTPALTCLAVAVAAGGDIDLSNSSVSGSTTISSNGTITSAGSIGTTNLEAVVAITGSQAGTGTRTVGVKPREFPDSTVFDYYVSHGTAISSASVPASGGVLSIDKRLLSPLTNPFGSGANPNGIYVINCNGLSVSITSSRIVGTLVLLNAPSVSLQSSCILEPAVANYPCLMVQGDLDFKTNGNVLGESLVLVNFNPVGVPYPYNGGAGGTANSTMTDSYPSVMNGLCYVSGNLTTASNPALNGVMVVGGSWIASSSMALSYTMTCYANPPPGFGQANQMGTVAGNWRWEQSP